VLAGRRRIEFPEKWNSRKWMHAAITTPARRAAAN
jgi:hypothetical protein